MAKNKSNTWGGISQWFLNLKTTGSTASYALEFVLAFGMVRDVLCSANPSRREELNLYLHAVVDLGYKNRVFVLLLPPVDFS